MSRSNIAKLYKIADKLDRRKLKMERRLDNIKRMYVSLLQTIDTTQNDIRNLKNNNYVIPITIPIVPEDAVLPKIETLEERTNTDIAIATNEVLNEGGI